MTIDVSFLYREKCMSRSVAIKLSSSRADEGDEPLLWIVWDWASSPLWRAGGSIAEMYISISLAQDQRFNDWYQSLSRSGKDWEYAPQRYEDGGWALIAEIRGNSPRTVRPHIDPDVIRLRDSLSAFLLIERWQERFWRRSKSSTSYGM